MRQGRPGYGSGADPADGGGFDYGELLDMQMWILSSGRVRDRHEFRGLLQTAGLRLRRITAIPKTAIVAVLPE